MLTRVPHPEHGYDCVRLTLDEYTLHTPPIPTDRRAYLNGDVRDVRKQKFQHTSLPTAAVYRSWSPEQQKQLENQEWDRRLNGVWFFNCGEPTYLTGKHYYYLNYHRYAKNSKPEYREANLEFFYVWQYCLESENCYGLYLHTRRRDGKTSRSASIGLESATRIPGFRFIIASKTEKSARDSVFKNEVVRPLKALRACPWFMPALTSKIDPVNDIVFGSISTTARAALEQESSEDDISSSVSWFLPTPNAADSDDADFLLNDEVAKDQAFNAYKRFIIIKPQLAPNGYIKGKAINATTTDQTTGGVDDDDEDASTRKTGTSARRAKQWWSKSDHTKLKPGEQTESGCFRLFVSARQGMKVDEYGRDTEAGLQHFLNRRRGLKGIDLLNEMRENPLSIDEALKEPVSGKNDFNAAHLNDALEAIEAHELRTGKPLLRRYRLTWADEVLRLPPVTAVPDELGPWEFSWLPKAEELNQMLPYGYADDKQGRRWRKYKPMATDDTSIGNDPVMRLLSSINNKAKASQYAIAVIRPWNEWAERRRGQPDYWPTEAMIGRYNQRPEDPDTCYEEACKACHLFGTEMHCEKQTNDAQVRYFQEHGYGECLADAAQLADDDAGRSQNGTGTAASPTNTRRMMGLGVQFVNDFVGSENTENAHGVRGVNKWGLPYDYRRLPFLPTIRDLQQFDPSNTRVYDDAIAFLFALSHANRRTRRLYNLSGGEEDNEDDGSGVDPSLLDLSTYFRS